MERIYKMRLYITNCLLFLIINLCTPIKAQEQLRNPFNFPIVLSGNFGELRPNHFHSGIDFKTQGVEGKPVHTVNDGHISRIGVSPWGYGNVLYISHPDGTTTVYAHLQKFAPNIEEYVRMKQYENESFTINLNLTVEMFPVKRGDVIGLGGNSGNSGGPHLHFEVRDTKTEEVIDPLIYYRDRVEDTTPPRIHSVMIYPVEGEGIVNGSNKARELKLITANNGRQTISGKIEAWGEVALGIKTFDAMNGTSNIYGVKEVVLKKDSVDIFRSDIERFSFGETRYLNSYIDYAEWRNNNSQVIKAFTENGNRLNFVESRDRGIFNIDEERTYHLSFHLKDFHGNTRQLSVWIDGKKQDVPAIDTTGVIFFRWISDNRFGARGVRLSIPRGNLYSDLYMRYSVREDSTALSAIHTLHDEPVPLHENAQLSLHLQHDTLENKAQYGIIQRHRGRRTWIGGTYNNRWINANIRELGSYTIAADLKPPLITPINPATWVKNRKIVFRLSDDLSGVSSYRGEIDGQYVLFEYDGKKGLISYTFDPERLTRGKHELLLTVTDTCGNQSEYTHTFTW